VRAATQRLKDLFLVLEDGEHQDRHLRKPLPEGSESIDTGHSRQLDVEEEQVRWLGGIEPEERLDRAPVADHAKTRCAFEEIDEQLAGPAVVLDEGDSEESAAGVGVGHAVMHNGNATGRASAWTCGTHSAA
jgi:hypothetical protein